MLINTLRICALSAASSFFALLAPTVNAAWVPATEVGSNNFGPVLFDDSATDSYGAPLVLSDTVVFTPGDMIFEVEGGCVVKDGPWTTSVLVNEDGTSSLEGVSITLTERGDFSSDAEVEFVLNPRVFIYSIDNPSEEFAIFDFDFSVGSDGATTLEDWSFSDSFELPEFAADGFLLTIQNNVSLGDGDYSDLDAFLQKKYVGITIRKPVSEVPVPGSVILMGSALTGLVVVRRRVQPTHAQY